MQGLNPCFASEVVHFKGLVCAYRLSLAICGYPWLFLGLLADLLCAVTALACCTTANRDWIPAMLFASSLGPPVL